MVDATGSESGEERPRPRVVDKRVSAGGGAGAARTAPSRQPAPEPAAPEAPPEPMPPADAGGEDLWTPEQEAEARRFAQQLVDTPSRDWVVNVAVTLANVAAAKVEAGVRDDARVAIDALAAVVSSVGPDLGEAQAPLRQTLAQLQMAYAQTGGPAGPGVPPAG
jgi:hypothetical protein